uniref:Alpha-1,2-fucosyltransferase n=1 Tax=viral metagenome TaxID=1070528 RepID=A0A6C0EW09_9ZZZZ
MITCNLNGGLGNQLFQIFATIAYSLLYKIPFGFLYKESLGGRFHNRPTYWHSFLSSLANFNYESIPTMLPLREQNFMYNELPSPVALKSENIVLSGYFQSYKYFAPFFPTICKLIRLDKQREQVLNEMATIYDISHITNMVSMHFRIGDYKYLQNSHPLISIEYYKKSITHIISSTNNPTLSIIYFCEKEDNVEVLDKIDKLRIAFPECSFIKAPDNIDDWKQLLLMSCCNHHIIANSSFSWWGAYFNLEEDKIVCYPDPWFGPSANHNIDDLFPDTWTKISA